MKAPFPTDFLWGASTAGHQIDGNTDSQWDDWERRTSARRPAEMRRDVARLPRSAEIVELATLPSSYVAGAATDHYNRYEADFDILGQLDMNCFRFSIEWSRLEPQPGVWDEAVIEHYRAYIASLRRRGIEPFVTLWHFTHPVWFETMGGFSKRRNLYYFERYVQKVCDELLTDVQFVMPLNEPNTYALLSYGIGIWPPQKNNLLTAGRVYRNLARCQTAAYRIIKASRPEVQVGVNIAYSVNKRLSRSPLAWLVIRLEDHLWYGWYLHRISRTYDFIGMNFYMTNYHTWYGAWKNPAEPSNDYGWYMEPAAIADGLRHLAKRYDTPLYVTENGLADRTDRYRQWWLQETLLAMTTVLAEGVDLRGYLHWSLLDNFEWAEGWLMQFGLVAVDRSTLQRTVRPSAVWFGQQIKRFRGL